MFTEEEEENILATGKHGGAASESSLNILLRVHKLCLSHRSWYSDRILTKTQLKAPTLAKN